MSRGIDSNGVPESLEPEAIKNFLSIGIPYRLAMLDLAEDVSPAQTTRDSAVVEAGIVAGRLLIQFLGFGIERRGGLRIAPRHSYYVKDGYTDEVKITDLGGRFVDAASLDPATAQVLAHFYNGASKASAHLTWDSGHQLDLENFKQSIPVIRDLVRRHLPHS
jgi:hypothetical protein